MNRLFKFFAVFLISATIPFFAEDIPNGYKNVKLGMSLDQVKSELKKDSEFGYHGDRDVSLLPNSNNTLIETDTAETATFSHLTQCYFQFTDEKLYIITININQNKMDYYSIFTKLCEKYGKPNTFTPDAATWISESTTMSLEKPLTLKYIDNKSFESLLDQSNVQKAGNEITKEQFLDEL